MIWKIELKTTMRAFTPKPPDEKHPRHVVPGCTYDAYARVEVDRPLPPVLNATFEFGGNRLRITEVFCAEDHYWLQVEPAFKHYNWLCKLLGEKQISEFEVYGGYGDRNWAPQEWIDEVVNQKEVLTLSGWLLSMHVGPHLYS